MGILVYSLLWVMSLRTLNYGNYGIFLIVGNDLKDPKLRELWYIHVYSLLWVMQDFDHQPSQGPAMNHRSSLPNSRDALNLFRV